MTPEHLAAIRERANNATEGPWAPTQETLTHPSGYEIEGPDTYIAAECCGYTGSVDHEADAVFIAAARTDIPALLDHVDTLAARLEAVRELHQERPNSTSALYPNPLCSCGKEYPCPTIQAIEGDQ